MSGPRRSQAEYVRRMHAVIEHIDRHLDEKLDLATLAAVAHFSDFHFHRLFGALQGEALGDYVRRRRLEVAAVRLRAQPDVPILSIALGVGFGSTEAFARAFRSRFGYSPSGWRMRKNDQVSRKHGQEARKRRSNNGATSQKGRAMNVKLIERLPVHVVYLRRTGAYGPPVSEFWMKSVSPWMGANNLFGRERFGISLDDPSVTKPGQCRYDACIASPEGEVLTMNPGRKIIPGGRYASLAFSGTVTEIGTAWDALLRVWLPSSGLQLDSRPFFEHYPVDGSFDPQTGRFTCNICVPVAPL